MGDVQPWQMTHDEWREATREGRWQVAGSRVRGAQQPDSDFDIITVLTPEESAAWRAGEGWPADVVADLRRMRGQRRKVQAFAVVEEPWVRDPSIMRPEVYQIIGQKRGKWVNSKAASIAGGLPKEEYPRPLYGVHPHPDGWVVAQSDAPGMSYTPLEDEVFDTAAAAWARADELAASHGGPRFVYEPGWSPAETADAGHRFAVEQALRRGDPVPDEVLAGYADLAQRHDLK